VRTVVVTLDAAAERFVAAGTHRGHTIEINAPHRPDEKRAPTGFSATELLLAGAGSCASWDVMEILRKRRADISALEVVVEGHQDPQPPWTYRRVALHFRIAGSGLKVSVLARVVGLSIVRYCSVITTIAGVAAIEATVELVAPDGTTSGRRPIELAIPAQTVAETDVPAVGVPEPLADED
jgi:putative redox protein